MPRYIDADELWLQLDKRESFEQGRNRAYYKGLRDAKKVLHDTLTADVVEVVRCKDCKHWKDSDGVYRRGVDAESKCPLNLKEVYEGTFYCGRAERREKQDG